MRSRILAGALLLVSIAFGAIQAHAASVVEREFRFAPDRIALKSRDGVTEVSARGAMREYRAGRPDLPWLPQRVELPDGMRIAAIEVIGVDTEPLAQGVQLPAAAKVAPGLGPLERSVPDAGYFGHAGMEPRTAVELGSQGYERGQAIAVLNVCPVQWNPTTGALQRVSAVRVRLTLEAADAPLARERVVPEWEDRSGLTRVARPLSAGISTLDGREAQPFKPTQVPSVEGSPVQYVIITNEVQQAQFQRLADWKTRTGVPAVVRTLSFIKQEYPFGSDDAERVRMFIRDAYTRWGTKFVLLGGDTEVLPTRFPYTLFYGGNYIACDLYFSALEGNWNADGDSLYGEGYFSPSQPGDACDLFPEVYVGRSPTVSADQAELFVDKTLQYIQNPVGDYERNILFFAEVLFPQDWSPGMITSLDGAELVEEVLPILQSNPSIHYARLYENHLDPRWEAGSLLETVDAVKDSLDRGYNMSVHVGHGYRNIMSVGNGDLTNPDAIGMSNGNRLTNLYAINCTSNAIDFASIGEAYMLAPNGGAVTNIGSTHLDFPTAGRAYQTEYFRLVYEDSVTAVGEAQARAKLPYIAFSTYDGVNRWTQMTLLMLGDPELRVWTGTPRTLTVAHAASVAPNDTAYTVNVSIGGTPLYGARVTAYRAGMDLKSALTNGAGNVTLPFRPDSAGSFDLTVTGYDCRPYRTTVTITGSALPVLEAEAIQVDDDGVNGTVGNGDGLIDAGETVDLLVSLSNNGGSAANSVVGQLTTTDGLITITVPTVNYGTLNSASTSVPAIGFRIVVPATAPDQREVPFTLTLTDNLGRRWVRALQQVVRAPDLAHYLNLFNDNTGNGNGRPETGESVSYTLRLRNNGTGKAAGITAVLRSYSPMAIVTDSLASWPLLAPRQDAASDALAFTVNNPSAVLELRISGPSGLLWVKPLDLVFPDAPSAVAGVGASTNIRLQWHRSLAGDLRGYNIYRSLVSGGPYTRVNAVPTDRTAYYLDEGLQTLTRYYYTVTAVDSSGNESFQSAASSASTNPPLHGVFPIAMARETPSSVAVDHLYPGYPMSVVAGSNVLYVWHPDGHSPVDADGASSTSGDFTKRGSYYASAPSIGDIDADGVPEIIGASWDSTRVYTFDLLGNVRPGWPLVTSDAVWSSAALGDLDNDGTRELVFGSNNTSFYAMRQNGLEWLDGDTNPATKGVFKTLGAFYNFGTPAIADLDGNGVRDIIYGSADGNLYAWRPNGSNLPGFPITLGGSITASAAIGYLDGPGDTQLEVVVGSTNDSLYVFKSDGGRRPGFPIWIRQGGSSKTPSPALADMNNDGKLDIVQASTNGGIYVVNGNGAYLSPWVNIRYSGLTTGAAESSPSVADINGDGWNDIVIGEETGLLSAFSGQGAVMLPGFPIQLAGEVRGAPALCDFDGDGLTEILLSGWDKNLYVWDYDFPFSPAGAPPWPQFHHDAMRSGLSSNAVFVAVEEGPPPAPLGAASLQLSSPMPNPSRNGSRLAYAVPADAVGEALEIGVYDLSGRHLATLARGAAQAGQHRVEWDLRDASGMQVRNGIYFVNLRLGSQTRSQKLIVMR